MLRVILANNTSNVMNGCTMHARANNNWCWRSWRRTSSQSKAVQRHSVFIGLAPAGQEPRAKGQGPRSRVEFCPARMLGRGPQGHRTPHRWGRCCVFKHRPPPGPCRVSLVRGVRVRAGDGSERARDGNIRYNTRRKQNSARNLNQTLFSACMA